MISAESRLFACFKCIVALGARAEAGFRLFPNLVELQLLMAMMADSNLSDIYGFFKYCPCPRLEKLFFEVGRLLALLI